jgi:pSer/pThr/pTyr-binding forkhead associated (FHA) protein
MDRKVVVKVMELVVRTGPQAGMQFPLDRAVVRIGRGSGSDILLDDSQASRQHAEISRQGDKLSIRDLGSTNGTYVNDSRITSPRSLGPGDRVRIGETTLICQAMAPAGVPPDWESSLWNGDTEAQPSSRRSKALVWGLAGLASALLVAVVVVGVVLLREDSTDSPPVSLGPDNAQTEAIVVVPTDSELPAVEAQPTATESVAAPTTDLLPTVEVQSTVPPVNPLPTPEPPAGVPSAPQGLEQLPATVASILGDVPAHQLPEALASQIQSMPREQVQQMIASLFPGVDITDLPAVVAASFPGLSESDVQDLLGMVFPGQTIQIPEAGPVGGRMALGIFDEKRGLYDLYLANATGGQPILLAEEASDPSFSPDGAYLVYHSATPDKIGLRIIKVDGSEDAVLTSTGSDRNPRFSPDGTLILFSNIDNHTLHTIRRDGTDRRDIGQGNYPDWSPDGRQIVYQGCVAGGRCGLIVANADGSDPRQITTHPGDSMPRWRYGNIAFLSDRDGNFEVYVINPDGTWLRRITREPATDMMPTWDPNGIRLAFRSDRGGDPSVYITTGIGGADFRQFSARFGSDWTLAGMDWGK